MHHHFGTAQKLTQHKLFTKLPEGGCFEIKEQTVVTTQYQTSELAETSATKVGKNHDSAQNILQKPPRCSSFWRQRLQNFGL